MGLNCFISEAAFSFGLWWKGKSCPCSRAHTALGCTPPARFPAQPIESRCGYGFHCLALLHWWPGGETVAGC